MTQPPQGSHEPDRDAGDQADPDRHPTQPVPSVDGPHQPYGGPAQPYAGYGQPQPGGPPGPPAQPPSQPYGRYGQAGYGSPGYGPPPYGSSAGGYGQAPATSRVGLIAAVTAGIVALIALAVVLILTLSTTVLDRNAVEQDVAAQFEQREGVAVELECSEEMAVTSGATYDCTGTTADGEDVTLQIAVTDEETAAYTWTEP
jgi:hypothetical protein